MAPRIPAASAARRGGRSRSLSPRAWSGPAGGPRACDSSRVLPSRRHLLELAVGPLDGLDAGGGGLQPGGTRLRLAVVRGLAGCLDAGVDFQPGGAGLRLAVVGGDADSAVPDS